MPDLDQIFAKPGVPAFAGPQCWSAIVVALKGDGAYVVLPGFDRQLRWGPCLPADADVGVGDAVAVTQAEDGSLWLVGVGGGDGSGGGNGGNIDGGFPDSVYGGVPLIDGNGVTR